MNTVTQNRARKGGQIGANGLSYAGGTFLPNTTLAKMATGSKSSGTRKQIIAPYTWEVAPEGRTSLFGMFRDFVNLQTGVVNQQACLHYGRNPEAMYDLFILWADGERWVMG